MTNNKNLSEILSEIIVERGITIDKLSILTNIPKRYLSAIIENDARNMPAAPYMKGYIAKIGTILEIDPQPMIDAYKKASPKTSGKDDSLPQNRFVTTQGRPKLPIIIIAIIVVSALYVGKYYILPGILGIPSIEINIPAFANGEAPLETYEQIFTIQGTINPRDSITISGELVPVSPEGLFAKEVLLHSGLNTFEIRVQRFLGREITVTRQIFYITNNLNQTINNYGEEIIQEE